MPDVQLAGVCDLSRALAEATAERFHVPASFTESARMLAEIRPDVVHVLTPPTSHFALAREAIESGAHVIVEKPITTTFDELKILQQLAVTKNRVLIEDYNYLFNREVRRIQELIRNSDFGTVVHVEVMICLNILADGNAFCDPNVSHPTLKLAGGAIADFLPHLASLAHAFVGPHRSLRTIWRKRLADSPLPADEFQALVNAEHGTASLGFTAHAQPDVFWLRVYGTRMRATANLFENRLTIDRLRGGPRPLMPLQNAMVESATVAGAGIGSLTRKLSGGPGVYEGLWTLIRDTYAAIRTNSSPPVSPRQIEEVNRLVEDLKKPEFQF